MAKYETLRTFLANAFICTLICVIVITTYTYTVNNKENSKVIEVEKYSYREYKGDYGVSTKQTAKSSDVVTNKTIIECKTSVISNNDHYIKVKTIYGTVRGLIKNEFGIEINEFLGVPYAMPPIGNLRFEKPVKFNKWQGIKNTIDWPQICPQTKNILMNTLQTKTGKLFEQLGINKTWSEDCLYLNIWSPKMNNSLLPILVVIHGGALTHLGISYNGFYGGVLSALGNIVVVSFQYRLGFLGFMKYNDQTDTVIGNMGFYDQIMALEWIKDNIKYFGGNPNEITLTGESAGGVSIGLLMTSPLSRHLFKRAIIQSGSPFMIPQSLSQAFEKLYNNFINETSCANDQQKIKCLKKLDVNEIVNIQYKLFDSMPAYIPSIPHQLFPQSVRNAFDVDEADDDIYQKQVLLGINKNEGTLFMHLLDPDIFTFNPNSIPYYTLKNLSELMTKDSRIKGKLPFSVNETVSTIASMIGIDRDSDEDITEKLAHLITEFAFTCPTLAMANSLEQWNNTKVYLYYLTSSDSYTNWPKWMSVPHIEDLIYVFGTPLRFPQLYSGQDIDFSKRIIKIWTQFTRNGELLPQFGIEWPQYKENNTKHMELNANYAAIGSQLNETYCSLYETIISF